METAVVSTKDDFSCIWRIENFSYPLKKVGECIESPKFRFNRMAYMHFFQLCLSGEDDKPIGYRFCFETPTVHVFGYSNEISVFVGDDDLFDIPKKDKNVLNKSFWIPLNEIPPSKLFLNKSNSLLPHTLILGVKMFEFNELLKLPKDFLLTLYGVESRSFIWVVKGFENLQLHHERLHSLRFLSGHPQLTIKLFLTGILNEESIQCQIEQVESAWNSVACKISLLNARGKEVESWREENEFESSPGEQIWSLSLSISKKLLMSDKDSLFPNGVLSLRFQFMSSIGIVHNEFEEEFVTFQAPTLIDEFNILGHVKSETTTSNCLGKDLHCLYENEKFCDVKFHTENSTFPVHKSVICARSPVFLAMFERDMTENQTGIVGIPDLDDDTVERMILFMYTDTVQKLEWDSASKLYFAADKYGILPLRVACASFIRSQLNFNNACDVLVLSDRHRDDDLKLAVHEFISKSKKEILSSDKWKTFERNNLQLAVETLRILYLEQI